MQLFLNCPARRFWVGHVTGHVTDEAGVSHAIWESATQKWCVLVDICRRISAIGSPQQQQPKSLTGIDFAVILSRSICLRLRRFASCLSVQWRNQENCPMGGNRGPSPCSMFSAHRPPPSQLGGRERAGKVSISRPTFIILIKEEAACTVYILDLFSYSSTMLRDLMADTLWFFLLFSMCQLSLLNTYCINDTAALLLLTEIEVCRCSIGHG